MATVDGNPLLSGISWQTSVQRAAPGMYSPTRPSIGSHQPPILSRSDLGGVLVPDHRLCDNRSLSKNQPVRILGGVIFEQLLLYIFFNLFVKQCLQQIPHGEISLMRVSVRSAIPTYARLSGASSIIRYNCVTISPTITPNMVTIEAVLFLVITTDWGTISPKTT